MAKGKLSEAAKAYVVRSLACYDAPSVVVENVRKEFAETVTRQTVEGYDPNKVAGRLLSQKWRDLFASTREAFLSDQSEIGIAHRSVRLRKLAQQVDLNEQRGNSAMVAALLEQAAKEVGGAFTNRRELTGKDGKDLPVPVSPVTIFQLPDNGRG